jgi:glycosyltransferase involved in cell wall biosynthesis
MRKFCFVFRDDPFLVKNPRGGVLSNIKLIKGLSKYGEVSIWIPGKKNRKYIESRDGIEVCYIEFPVLKLSPLIFIKTDALKNIINDFKGPSDSIIIFGSKGSIPVAFIMRSLVQSKFFIITRDFNECIFRGYKFGKGKLKDYLRDVLWYNVWKRAYSNADCVIVNSRFLASEIKKNYSVKEVRVFYPQVDVIENTSNASKEARRETLNPRIGFMSGPEYKGIKLVENLAAKMSNFEFHVFNSGRCEKVGNMHYYGYSTLKEIFGTIDLLLVPSAWNEPYGRVAAEAIVNNIPVLCSDRGGLPEAANSKFFLVSSLDVDEWKTKLVQLISSPEVVCRELDKASELVKNTADPLSIDRAIIDMLVEHAGMKH